MDFVSGLSRLRGRKDTIWVIVGRLIKPAHFLPIKKEDKVEVLAWVYVKEIFQLHGAPYIIVSDNNLICSFGKGCKRLWA